jgi:hypothetical protein
MVSLRNGSHVVHVISVFVVIMLEWCLSVSWPWGEKLLISRTHGNSKQTGSVAAKMAKRTPNLALSDASSLLGPSSWSVCK